MISTSQFKSGVIIKFNNDLCEILEYQLVKMQQRQPIVSTKMRNLRTGNVLEQKFRSGDKFEDVYLEDKPIQYLYHEGNKYHFMDSESYHEIVVGAELLGDKINFLKDNSDAMGRYCGDEMISFSELFTLTSMAMRAPASRTFTLSNVPSDASRNK